MDPPAYAEVGGDDVEGNEVSRMITTGNADEDNDYGIHTSPRRIKRGGRLSGTPVVVLCSFVVGCLFGSIGALLGGYYLRVESTPNKLDCERATVFGISHVDEDEAGSTAYDDAPEMISSTYATTVAVDETSSTYATIASTEIHEPEDESTQPESEMAIGGALANAFVVLEERKHDPTAFT